MTLIGHKKHGGLNKPVMGNFGRNEFAIIGGHCSLIKSLADIVITTLSTHYQCAYADTSHHDDTIKPGRLFCGAALEYSDEINHSTINYHTSQNPYQLRELFALADFVLVNGNHQQAKEQIVIICDDKKASLQKRIKQLTNVQLFLLDEGMDEVFDFVKEAVPNWQTLPIFNINEPKKLIQFLQNKLEMAKPPINGLVLAGGKSERMGFQKELINWHGKEQQYYLADLLKPLCEQVYISCRDEQQNTINHDYNTLTDTFLGLGPMGAILSALRQKPDEAWLVIACDLPLVNEQTLQHLIKNRNTKAIATAYKNNTDNFPEPLIAIWEPKSYPVLFSFLAQGYSCPRKVLINSNSHILEAPEPTDLKNVNTIVEFEEMRQILNIKQPF